MQFATIFEDESILVINKPIGLTVNRSVTTKDTETLFDQIEHKATWSLMTENLEFNDRCGVVHRLDKETSGVLIIAKNPEAFVNLQAQFKAHEVKKKYLVLVHGGFEEGETNFTVDAPIGRNPRNRFRNAVVANGRPAITNFEIAQTFSKPPSIMALVNAYPQTGRTHQIRVHLTALNHPICGDDLYCPKDLYREYSSLLVKNHITPRMFLHASSITFSHPVTSSQMHLTAPLPPELASVLDLLGYRS